MYSLSQQYPSKRAFITGAASGLGKAFATELASDGWTIGMADNNLIELQKAVEEMKALGANALIYSLDVSDKDQYKSVSQQFLTEAGALICFLIMLV